MNNESNSTAIFLQELDTIEKELAAQLIKNKSSEANNLIMNTPTEIDNRLKIIFIENPFKIDIEKYKKIKSMLSLIQENVNERDIKLLQAVNKLLKELEKQLKDFQDKLGKRETNKKIWTGRIVSKIPDGIWSIATDSKGNVYVGTRNSSWHGNIYRCLAGQSEFKPMLGVDAEVWTIALDEDENIYIGTREGNTIGGVYKCLANENNFKKVAGINKCVSYLKFDGDTLLAKVWTGSSLDAITYNNTYKLVAGQSEFKPAL